MSQSKAPEIEVSVERKSLSTVELLNPKNTPEAAFQSYEMLISDASAQEADFLAGRARNPTFTYPHFFQLSTMDKGILHLYEAAEQIRCNEQDDFVAESCVFTLEFRQAEMEYVKLLGRLDYLVKSSASGAEVKEIVERARELNYELYGRPDPELVDMARNEIWDIIDRKQRDSSAEVIRRELEDGIVWGGLPISGLGKAKDENLHLPRFEGNEALEWAAEYVIEKNADIHALVEEFWYQKVEEFGDDYICMPEDMVEVFQAVIDMRDPGHESGVTVKLMEDKTSLSWEPAELAIHVGSKRDAFVDSKELFDKVMHEYGKHGQGTVNGLRHPIPVMATGVYTNTKQPDYLTFEEGFSSMIEKMSGDKVPVWDVIRLGHYLDVAEVEEGNDFRAVFEKSWRYRLLAALDDNEVVTRAAIDKAKTGAYRACVRIFRGQPNDISDRYPDIKPLSFNKDLSYLSGSVIAMNFISDCFEANDTASLDLAFSGKFDPTNPAQLAIARYGV